MIATHGIPFLVVGLPEFAKMPGHDTRSNMSDIDVVRISSTNGEMIDGTEEWGMCVELRTAGAETRKLFPPSQVDQKVTLTMTVDGGNCVVDAPTGQDFNGAGGDQATFADVGDSLTLESRLAGPGDIQWRVTQNIGSVAIA